MADALDSGSSEQYAHVGSSPVPRTIVKVAVRLLNSRERELHEALFSSTSKSLITLDLGYILGYVQRITTNSRSARHLWNERARRSFSLSMVSRYISPDS